MPALSVLPHTWAICRFNGDAPIPAWVYTGTLYAITRTSEELSIVALDSCVPDGVRCERGWRCLKVLGPLAFSAVGIVASLAGPLARAGIGIFVISTFDTDYLLVKEGDLVRTVEALSAEGHFIRTDVNAQ